MRTSIVSTTVGNRSTELVTPRDAFLKNRRVPVQQTVSTWADVQSLFQRRVIYRVGRDRGWLQCLLSTLRLLVKVLVCSVAWSEGLGKCKIVGWVLVNVDLHSAVFEVHIHKLGMLQIGEKSVVAVKLILMDGRPRGKSHCTSCERHGDEECTEKSLGQYLGFVDAVSCDTFRLYSIALL